MGASAEREVGRLWRRDARIARSVRQRDGSRHVPIRSLLDGSDGSDRRRVLHFDRSSLGLWSFRGLLRRGDDFGVCSGDDGRRGLYVDRFAVAGGRT